jgi:transcriptional regulator with XRE-family HTH domain
MLAVRTGIHPDALLDLDAPTYAAMVQEAEREQWSPTVELLARIAGVLGITVERPDWLVGEQREARKLSGDDLLAKVRSTGGLGR